MVFAVNYSDNLREKANLPCAATSEIASIVSQLHYGSSNTSIMRDPSIASTVLRALTESQRVIVLRMLNLRVPVPDKHILMWLGNHQLLKAEMLDKLIRSRLIIASTGQSGASDADSNIGSKLGGSASTVGKPSDNASVISNESGGNRSVPPKQSKQQTRAQPSAPVTYSLDRNFFEGIQQALSSSSRDKHGAVGFIQMVDGSGVMKTVDANDYNQSIHKCYVKAYMHWNGFLRWCFNDGVKVILHQFDGDATPNVTSIAMFSSPGWRKQPIRQPLKTVRAVATKLDLQPSNDGTVGWRNEAFMFNPPHKQLSQLVVQYITMIDEQYAADKSVDTDQIFTFFITLNQLKIGKACFLKALKSESQTLLHDFLEFLDYLGVVILEDITLPDGKVETIYYPTPMAKLVLCNSDDISLFAAAMESPHVTLQMVKALEPHAAIQPSMHGLHIDHLGKIKGVPPLDELEQDAIDYIGVQEQAHNLSACLSEGILVESNFKLFGYSNSSMHIALISRFSVIKVLTPTMVNSLLNRKSVHHALSLGITAYQITDILEYLAHHKVKLTRIEKTGAILPGNVSVQITMWEQERRRLRFRKATVFEFNREQDLDIYPVTVARCRQNNIAITCSATPDTINPRLDEFKIWKHTTLKEIRDRSTRGDSCTAINAFNYHQPVTGQITCTPCLVVNSEEQEKVTNFIKFYKSQTTQQISTGSHVRGNSSSAVASSATFARGSGSPSEQMRR